MRNEWLGTASPQERHPDHVTCNERNFCPPWMVILASFLLILGLLLVGSSLAMADTLTLRPNGLIATGGWTVNASDVGDNSDATFATITGSQSAFTVAMANDAAYSGATINGVTVWIRASVIGGGGQGEKVDFGPAGALSGTPVTLPDSPTISSFSYAPGNIFTDADLDNLAIDVATTALGAGEECQVYDVWVVVDYTPAAGNNQINSCIGCHQEPPLEGASRNAGGLGEVVGSHSNHSVYACTVCHPNNAVLNHRGAGGGNTQGQIDMLASIEGGSYSKGANFAQANDLNGTGLGFCSDVTCHGGPGSTTPQWGTTSGLACDGCHGAPPTTNAHSAHFTAKGWSNPDLTAASCTTCHPDNTAGHSDVTDGIVELNAALAPSGASPAISCGTTPAGCHNGNATPAWDSPTPIACTDCHTPGGANTGTLANPVSGLHNITAAGVQKHDDSLATGCTECHTKAAIGGHWDGVNGGDPPDYTGAQVGVTTVTGGSYTDGGGTGAVRGTCATTCHSDNGNWQRQWSTAADSTATAAGSARCAVCHGQFGDWRTGTSHEGTLGGSASTKGNSHNSLGGTGNGCEDCHVQVTSSANHENGFVTLNGAGAVLESGGRAWCSACHSDDGAPTTGGTHTFTQSDFPLEQIAGANDPIGSCTGCHGGGTAGANASNYWPDQAGNLAGSPAEGGRHLLHVQRLAAKLYGETVTQLLTDNGNGTSDAKQKAICEYCHAALTNDSDHGQTANLPADVFVDAGGTRHAKSLWGSNDLDAAYDKVNDSCSNVDCHNGKQTQLGSFGWYDGTTSTCTMCHTVGGAGANPTSGLHNIVPTVSGKRHDDSLTACATCHAALPAIDNTAAATHIDGSFSADSGSNTDRGLSGLYTDGSPGTCSGGVAGAAGCHDGAGDAGTWKRRWSTTAANSDGSECANCHGGFGANDWTFGSNNAVGDGSMSHAKDWDGNASLQMIGKHSGNTGQSDKCNVCHVYPDAPYGSTWGTGNHGNGKIDMNSTMGYSRSGGSAYGCTTNCHTTGGSHLTEGSGWTLNAVAGPALACTSCHDGTGVNNQFEVGPNSTHSTNTNSSGYTCQDCHFAAHSSRTSGTVSAAWDSRTMGTDYTADGKIYLTAFGGAANEAEACWNCHATNGISEWGKTWGSYQTGTITGGPNWIGASWQSANFSYKNGNIASVHQTESATSVDPAVSPGLPANASTISCTACHDVHSIGVNGYTPPAAPFLRGTWTSNPFKEDGAPGTGGTTSWTGAGYRGVTPRAAAGEGSTANNELGGWQIEQNNNMNIGDLSYGTFAGLCQKCHTQTHLEGAVGSNNWTGHKGVVSGFAGNTGNNFFRTGQRGGAGTWQEANMAHNGALVPRDTGKGWIGGLRNNRQWVDGIQPPMASEPTTSNVGLGYANGPTTSITVDDTTYQNNFHNFTCSKCHNPHASKLPRLMITNCLDVRHNTWDDQASVGKPNAWTPGTYSAGQLAYSPTAQNCHRYVGSGDGNRESGAEAGWNSVTPW